jgi:hypothetical protein
MPPKLIRNRGETDEEFKARNKIYREKANATHRAYIMRKRAAANGEPEPAPVPEPVAPSLAEQREKASADIRAFVAQKKYATPLPDPPANETEEQKKARYVREASLAYYYRKKDEREQEELKKKELKKETTLADEETEVAKIVENIAKLESEMLEKEKAHQALQQELKKKTEEIADKIAKRARDAYLLSLKPTA